MKKYRFFYHYYRRFDEMSVHFKGVCYRTPKVVCVAESETKRNKAQPKIVQQGFTTEIEVLEDRIIIH